MLTTKLSSKGQVILPKSVWEARHWPVGTEFTVEETTDGVLLRATRPFGATRLEDVAGCLRGPGPARTIEEMDRAIDDAFRDRHDRGRY